jgi:Bacterial Ig-like domain (group 3)
VSTRLSGPARVFWRIVAGVPKGATFGAFACLFATALPAAAQDWAPYTGAVGYATHAVSPEVRSLPNAPGRVSGVSEVPLIHRPSFVPPGPQPSADQALQESPGTSLSATSGTGFDGVEFNGYYPPDPNISVGDTQIVQTTNVQFAVYDKSGTLLKGPVNMNTLFTNLGGQCASTNGGDPIVLWDKIAHRWLISQLAYNSNFTQNSVCIAVSTSSDATLSFHLYGFSFSHLPDYPKFGVWSSSTSSGTSDYYFSANLFSTALYYGPVVCAFNGSDMQSGTTARSSCVTGKTSDFSLLPSDFDGATPPATGEANYFLELGTSGTATSGQTLTMWPFRATWTTTSGSLNNPTAVTINVNPYTTACSGGGACIPQPGTTQQVDSLGDRLMYRLPYRNFGTYESLLVNHSVDEGNGVVGIRWYEIRSNNSGGTLANSAFVYQQGTFSGLDTNDRWMGSIAQDKVGDIALGYSISNGSALYPSINYTGRVPSDSLGTMESEDTIVSGTGSETGGSRWGDYTSLSIDPTDDCTFWYNNEYFFPNSSSGVAWNTRIASFKFSTCGQGPAPTSAIVASSHNPSNFGNPVTFTATITSASAIPTGSVTFQDSGTTLSTATLDANGQATYTTSALSAGSHSITATYIGNSSFSASTSAPLIQTVNSTPTATTTTLSSSLNPSTAGQSVTFTAAVAPSSATGSVQFVDGGVTSLGTVALSAGSAQLSTSTLSAGSHSITATYSGDSSFTGSTSTTLTQTVNLVAAGSFSLSSSPTLAKAAQGSSAHYLITVVTSGGFAGNVGLAVSAIPAQSTGSFSSNPVSSSGSSTLTINVGSHTPKKIYTLTITGTSGGLSATITVTLQVQ